MDWGTAALRLGEVLGKYTLTSVLGVGGMATVYGAVHRTGNKVAVKLLHPHLAAHPEARARFVDEAYTANKIDHPGVVHVLDDDVTARGEAFMVMELLEGETLEAWQLRTTPRLPPDQVFSAIYAVLDVLARAHAVGIVHRDLKPENLFRTSEGRIKVLDFGIARALDESGTRPVTRAGSLLGTPGFMAPEQAQGRVALIDGRTDLWAIGATAFTLLSGRCVHEAETVALVGVASAMERAREVSTLVPGLPVELARVVDTALRFDKAERWSNAREMQEALSIAFAKAYGAPPSSWPARIASSAPESLSRERLEPAAPPSKLPTLPLTMVAVERTVHAPSSQAPSNEAPPAILVVDDDAVVGEIVGAQLAQAGFACTVVTSGVAALEALEARPFAMVLSDLRMPRMDGRALLKEIGARWSDVPVVLLTAHGTVALAVDAMKAGAADFLQKPCDREELLYVVGKLLAARRTEARLPSGAPGTFELVGSSEAILALDARVTRAAEASSPALVCGEPGSGKSLVARLVHDRSPRAKKAFIAVHCSAAPSEEVLDRDLFGYERGAFVGAAQSKPGRVELAHEGTLFLDEIAAVPLAAQAKLLRVLQERASERVGGTRALRVDVRLVAATRHDPAALVAAGRLREDLYYRLSVLPIEVPPLRTHPGDVEELAVRFTAAHAAACGRPVTLSAGALELLRAHPWPGNVRQLQSFVERLLVLSDGAVIEPKDVERELGGAFATGPLAISGPVSRERLEVALARAHGDRALAARLLGVSRHVLHEQLEGQGLSG